MKNLYILDDHPIVTEGLSQLLANNHNYQITTGQHHSELYGYLNHTIPDLLIIDYEIQDQTALEVLSYLRQKNSQSPYSSIPCTLNSGSSNC